MNEQRDPSRLPRCVRKTLKANRLITHRLISCDRRSRRSIAFLCHREGKLCQSRAKPTPFRPQTSRNEEKRVPSPCRIAVSRCSIAVQGQMAPREKLHSE